MCIQVSLLTTCNIHSKSETSWSSLSENLKQYLRATLWSCISNIHLYESYPLIWKSPYKGTLIKTIRCIINMLKNNQLQPQLVKQCKYTANTCIQNIKQSKSNTTLPPSPPAWLYSTPLNFIRFHYCFFTTSADFLPPCSEVATKKRWAGLKKSHEKTAMETE